MNDTKMKSENFKIPKVTVLMAVYNGERFLREAVDSILNQTFRDFEFLIINDGSTDGTHDILCSYHDPRINIVDNEENIGLTKSLNKGLAIARGEYVARMDADDISYPDRLEKQYLFMQHSPDVAVLGTQTNYIDCQGETLRAFEYSHPISPLAAKYTIIFNTPVSHPTVLLRKEVIWDKFRGYDPTYVVAQDNELWCRVINEHSIQNLPDALVAVRIHPFSVSSDIEHPRRINHLNQWRTYRPEVIRNILGENNIPNEWGEWWTHVRGFYPFIGKNATMELMRGIDNIQVLFFKKYPEAQGSIDITKLTANFKALVALYLVEYARLASIAAFYQVLKENREIAFLYAPKYLSLLMFGKLAKKIYKFVNKWKF